MNADEWTAETVVSIENRAGGGWSGAKAVADAHNEAVRHSAENGLPEVDWPCDFPVPHAPHEASAYDDLGILTGHTEHCHGGGGDTPIPPEGHRVECPCGYVVEGLSAEQADRFARQHSDEDHEARVIPPAERNCGWGGVHDPDNPRCALNGAVFPPGKGDQ